MAYADGALDAEAQARVAAAVSADATLAARVEAFASTGRTLGALFDDKLDEAPPKALLDLLQPPPAQSKVTPMHRPRQIWLPFALAASLALGVALGVSWPRPDAPAMSLAGLPDGAQLSATLERTASGELVVLATRTARVELMPTATYREATGRWCREFHATALDRDARTLGVACRVGNGQWVTEIAMSDAYVGIIRDEGFFAANGDAPLHGGETVSPETEAALIARGWQK